VDKVTESKISIILQGCVHRTIARLKHDVTHRPFHEALLSKEILVGSAFERSFSTSFGQGPIEEISKIIAESTGAIVTRQKESVVSIFKGAQDQINGIMSDLRAGNRSPNWESEKTSVCAVDKGDVVVVRVISDLHVIRDGKEMYFSIKTVKPNLDQIEIAKKNMLQLIAANPRNETYLGLYYNPGGNERVDYNWKVPNSIINMRKDPCVLIGKEYWDKLGGLGTYERLLAVFRDVGAMTRKEIEELS
jgi:hypothetical protein